MGAQNLMSEKAGSTKGGGFYLMELRQHTSQNSPRRQKLSVGDWSAPRFRFVPILHRNLRVGQE